MLSIGVGGGAETIPMPTELTDDERALLAFEDTHPKHTPAKENAIIGELHMSGARYYQTVFRLLSDPGVKAEYPQLASRTMRLLQQRGSRRVELSRIRAAA
jgi:hypothetical protein